MAGIDLDLREARFTSPETTIRVFAIWSGVDIIVNAHTRVVVDGVGIMGDFSQGSDKVEPEIGPDSPVVRVTGFALMAGVSVRRRPMPGGRRSAAGCWVTRTGRALRPTGPGSGRRPPGPPYDGSRR